MFLGCISTVVVRGIGIDGELIEDGTGDWLIPYISLIDTPVFDVPFPEPWVCRFLCTSQVNFMIKITLMHVPILIF